MKDKTDILNREDFINRVVALLETLSQDKRGTAFAINGEWGSGKTFVLEKIEERIQLLQSEQTCDDKFFVFHYNCWQYDYYDEPVVAIVSSMLECATEMEASAVIKAAISAWNFAKERLICIGNELVKNRIGVDIVGTIEEIKKIIDNETIDYNAFDNWYLFKKTVDKTREVMGEIAEKKTIIIVVDELDRCQPKYAMKVMERLHHIFDGLSNIVVIYGVDFEQLSNAVGYILGTKDKEIISKYFKKFIQFELLLDNGEVQREIWEKYEDYFALFSSIRFRDEKERIIDIVQELFATSGMDIRSQERIVDQAMTIHRLIVQAEDGTVDYSILLFELMVSIFCFLTPETSLNNLAEIYHTINNGMDNSLGKDLALFLRELSNDTNGNTKLMGNITDGEIECKNTINLSFYYLEKLFSKQKRFAGSRIEGIEDELEICKKYVEMIKLLKLQRRL